MAEIKEVIAKFVDAAKVDEVLTELNKELPLHYIPKTKFNEVNDELKLTKQQLMDTNKSVEDLSKKAASVEEYQKQIDDLKKKSTDLEANTKAQIEAITKRTKLKDLLVENGAHKDATDLLVEKYLTEAEVDDKGIKEPKKLIDKIKTEKAGLFLTEHIDSNDKGGGKGNPPGASDTERLNKLFGIVTAPVDKTGGK